MEETVSFGQILRKYRRTRDLTQEQLARRANCALTTIKKVEADERRPSRELAERFPQVLEVPETDVPAFLRLARDDPAAARPTLEESVALFREVGDRKGLAVALVQLGIVARLEGDHTRAAALLEESLALYRLLGDIWGIAVSFQSLGEIASNLGEHAVAQALWEKRLTVEQELDHKNGIASSFHHLGRLAHLQGNYERATTLFEQSLALWRKLNMKPQVAWAICNTRPC